ALATVHWDLVANPKRRSPKPGGWSGPLTNAPASWTAAVLRRFRRASGLRIPTVHGEPPFAFLRMHWGREARFCLTLTLRSSMKDRIKSKKSSAKSETFAQKKNPLKERTET